MATRCKIAHGSLQFSTKIQYPFCDYPKKMKHTEKNVSDRTVSPRQELDASVQEWTETKSGPGEGETGEGIP